MGLCEPGQVWLCQVLAVNNPEMILSLH